MVGKALFGHCLIAQAGCFHFGSGGCSCSCAACLAVHELSDEEADGLAAEADELRRARPGLARAIDERVRELRAARKTGAGGS
jgi:hypothetical protein